MAEAKIRFIFNGNDMIFQYSKNSKMKEVCLKYSNKLQKDINSLIFLYAGNKLDYEKTFNELATSDDKKKNEMRILVYKMEIMIMIKNLKMLYQLITKLKIELMELKYK